MVAGDGTFWSCTSDILATRGYFLIESEPIRDVRQCLGSISQGFLSRLAGVSLFLAGSFRASIPRGSQQRDARTHTRGDELFADAQPSDAVAPSCSSATCRQFTDPLGNNLTPPIAWPDLGCVGQDQPEQDGVSIRLAPGQEAFHRAS